MDTQMYNKKNNFCGLRFSFKQVQVYIFLFEYFIENDFYVHICTNCKLGYIGDGRR